MRITETCTLIQPDETRIDTMCFAIQVRGSDAEEGGVRIALGSLQIVIDSQGVTEDWNVEFRGRLYGIAAITPYLKRKYPKRDVLMCERIADRVLM